MSMATQAPSAGAMNQDWVNDWYSLGLVADVAPGSVIRKRVRSIDLALFNIDAGYFARSDACGGCGRPLSDCRVDEKEVECSHCGLRLEIARADDPSAPAQIPVMVVNNEIFACIKNPAEDFQS